MGREHGQLSFHLTQILTGHGSFAAYIHRIGKDQSDTCHHCGQARDTAQHTLQDCSAWREQRAILRDKVGEDLSLPALVGAMLANEEGWRAVGSFSVDVMLRKENAEREREGRARPPTSKYQQTWWY